MNKGADMDIEQLLARLSGVRRSGAGWKARCPNHPDQRASLSITVTHDGTILLYCFAGCSTAQVLAAVGLTWRDLYPARCNGHASERPVGERPQREADATTADPIAWWSSYCAVSPDFVRSLPLRVEGRRLCFQFDGTPVIKARVAGRKEYTWIPSGAETPPLWPSPAAALPPAILIVEGESDCTIARYMGIPAYAATKGANGALTLEQARALRQRGVQQVYLCFDADQAGQLGARAWARALLGAGLQAALVDLVASGLIDPLVGQKDLRDAWCHSREWEHMRTLLDTALQRAVPFAPDATSADDAAAPFSIPVWPTLADEAYYGLAGDVVRALSPATEADPAALLLTFLAAFGAALGRDVYCQVGMDRHPLRIWPVLVGETSKGRKGSAWAAVRAVLLEADRTFFETNVASGLSSGEGLVYAVRDPVTRLQPVKQGGRVTDYERVIDDEGQPDKRLLIIEEEFSSVLKVLKREGNTLSAVLRQAWDRGDLRVLTKNNPMRATGTHIVVVGHGVADEMRRHLTEVEVAGGWANRHLWCCVRRARCLPRGGLVDATVLAALGTRVRQALERGRTLGQLSWSMDAAEYWDALYPALSEGQPGLYGAMIARLEAHALRLAGLYAVLDQSRVLRPAHLLAAMAIVDYVQESTYWIFGGDTQDNIAERIVEALQERGEMTSSDIRDLFGRNLPSERYRAALCRLLGTGQVQVTRIATRGRGRPIEVWRLAQHLTTKTI